ncbi:9290_t:CDS:2 [Gigaspora margarita]|uniref:9290_t:CDS:1 n=1 Tax=Gigaspora margarita TaxID=4874 RepID=A0ABN7W7X0_GIGMA|nr:9290_t:CDS:2 [Gigaspora margarita]
MTEVLIPKYSEKEMLQINIKISIIAAIQMDNEKYIVIEGYCKNGIGVKDEFKTFNHPQEAEMDNVNEIEVKTNKNKTFVNHQGLAYRNLKARSGMLMANNNRKNHASLPNSRRWTKVYSDRLDIKNMKLGILNDRKVYSSDKDLVSKQRQSILGSIKKVEFLKHLYLEQLARCDYEHLESAIFGSRLELRKLGRLDLKGRYNVDGLDER